MNVSKVWKVKLKPMLVAIIAFAPLLLVGGRAFGVNSLGIKNAVYASQVNCLDGEQAILENSGLCAFYGQLGTFNPPAPGAVNFTIPFKPYDEMGNRVNDPQTGLPMTITVYVGADTFDPSLGSGPWVSDHLLTAYDLLDTGKNRRGSIIAKLEEDGNFYAVPTSAGYGQTPFGTTGALDFDGPLTEPTDMTPSKVVAMWRAYTCHFNNLRDVTTHHVWHNKDFFKDVNWSTVSLSKLTIMTQRVYRAPVMGGYMWFFKDYATTYTTNGSNWTTSYSTSMPADYTPAADQTIPYNDIPNPSLCTFSTPCTGSKGLYMMAFSDNSKVFIGTKTFTETQLANLDNPEVDKIPCPFAAYSIDSGKVALTKAMQNHYKFKFNYVNGTNTNVGNFSGKKWLIGRVVTEITEFRDINDVQITDKTYPSDFDKILALMGKGPGGPNNEVTSDQGPWPTIRYNNTNCSCIEIYY